MSDIFSEYAPFVQDFIYRNNWESLRAVQVAAGDVIVLESGSRLLVVSPTRSAGPKPFNTQKDRNDQSIVFLFVGEELTALFTGDSSSKIEAEYVGRLKDLSADLLKVAHHGSKNSTSRLLPTVGIVSASATNRYGHPSPETLERLKNVGCSVYSTSTSGYLRLRCSGGNISVLS